MEFQLLTHSEQLAGHIRSELLRGRWRGKLPGIARLGRELEVNHNTVKAALALLEAEGLLVSQGHGRPRLIEIQKAQFEPALLRVKILLFEQGDQTVHFNSELLGILQKAGFAAEYAMKTLKDLGMKPQRVARFVARTPCDAWIVSCGSRAVLEWFAQQPTPAIAMFGCFSGVPIAAACPRAAPALRTVVHRLIELGHRRIVMPTRKDRLDPRPALFEQSFLDEMMENGLSVGDYNLPIWEEQQRGFMDCLESLFRHTPPTAIVLCEGSLVLATQQFLSRRGLVVPEDVSLVSSDFDPAFKFCRPAISHLRADYGAVVQRVSRWTKRIAQRKSDTRQTLFDAEFVEGGTIGKAP